MRPSVRVLFCGGPRACLIPALICSALPFAWWQRWQLNSGKHISAASIVQLEKAEESERAQLEQALAQWLVGGGGFISAGIAVARKHGKRGIWASRTLNKGEPVIRVPRRLLLTAFDVDSSMTRELLARAKDLAKQNAALVHADWPNIAISIALATEAMNTSASRWKAYILSLPDRKHFSGHPAMFPESLLRQCLGTDSEAFAQTADMVRRLKNELWGLHRLTAWQPEIDEVFSWARLNVLTRAFSIPSFQIDGDEKQRLAFPARPGAKDKTPVLVPFGDLLNHDPQANIEWAYEVEGAGAEGNFVMRAKRLVVENDELSISYGDKKNVDLFSQFGFSLTGNVHDSLIVQVNFGISSGPHQPASVALRFGLAKPDARDFKDVLAALRSAMSKSTKFSTEEAVVKHVRHHCINKEMAFLDSTLIGTPEVCAIYGQARARLARICVDFADTALGLLHNKNLEQFRDEKTKGTVEYLAQMHSLYYVKSWLQSDPVHEVLSEQVRKTAEKRLRHITGTHLAMTAVELGA